MFLWILTKGLEDFFLVNPPGEKGFLRTGVEGMVDTADVCLEEDLVLVALSCTLEKGRELGTLGVEEVEDRLPWLELDLTLLLPLATLLKGALSPILSAFTDSRLVLGLIKALFADLTSAVFCFAFFKTVFLGAISSLTGMNPLHLNKC